LSKRARYGIIIGVVGIALAIFGILFLSQLFRQSLSPIPLPTEKPPITVQVVVTTHDIALGTLLQAEDLKLAELPVESVPSGVLSELETVSGRYTKVDLVAGEMILAHHLADPTNINHDVGFSIDDNQVLMAFPASDLMSSLSVIQRGDQVDIFVTVNEQVPVVSASTGEVGTAGGVETEGKDFTFDAMQRVQVTAMVVDIIEENRSSAAVPVESISEATPQPTALPQAQTRTRAYLLALDPQDALVLKHLKDKGAEFDIVLRSPTSNQLFDMSPVTSEYLIDRYQLESIR
jgi:Flp pilus assembly protein CpaB